MVGGCSCRCSAQVMSCAGVPIAIHRAFGCMQQIFSRSSRGCTCAHRDTRYTSCVTRHTWLQIRVQTPSHRLEQSSYPRRVDADVCWRQLQVRGSSHPACQLVQASDSVCAASQRGPSTRSSACGAGGRCCAFMYRPRAQPPTPSAGRGHCVAVADGLQGARVRRQAAAAPHLHRAHYLEVQGRSRAAARVVEWRCSGLRACP